MAGAPDPVAAREARNRAIGTLIWKDPARILETVARLRGTGTILECTLRGASMGTAIPRGAALRIDLQAISRRRVGEIVAFVQDSGVCVHRVAYQGRGARRADWLITQGDACLYPDPPLETSRVLGPVIAYRDNGDWRPTAEQPSPGRAQSRGGRLLLGLAARLMEVDVRLARAVARLLRLRQEGPAGAEP